MIIQHNDHNHHAMMTMKTITTATILTKQRRQGDATLFARTCIFAVIRFGNKELQRFAPSILLLRGFSGRFLGLILA